MIEGVVNAAYEPVVALAVRGPSGQSSEIEAVVDTGFNGFLTVTPALAAELELPLEGTSRATLADGSSEIGVDAGGFAGSRAALGGSELTDPR